MQQNRGSPTRSEKNLRMYECIHYTTGKSACQPFMQVFGVKNHTNLHFFIKKGVKTGIQVNFFAVL